MKDPSSTKKLKLKSKKQKHKKDFIKLKDVPIEVIESIASAATKVQSLEPSSESHSDSFAKTMSLEEYKQLLLTDNIETLASNIKVDGYRHKTPIKILEELRTKCLLDYELSFKSLPSDDAGARHICALGSLLASGLHAKSSKLAKHSSAAAMLQKILPSMTLYYDLQELVKRTPRVIVKKGKFQGVTAKANGKVPEGPRPPCKYPAVFDSNC